MEQITENDRRRKSLAVDQETYDLLTDIFSSLADLDSPPAEDENFDSLWDAVLNADHQIITEDA